MINGNHEYYKLFANVFPELAEGCLKNLFNPRECNITIKSAKLKQCLSILCDPLDFDLSEMSLLLLYSV